MLSNYVLTLCQELFCVFWTLLSCLCPHPQNLPLQEEVTLWSPLPHHRTCRKRMESILMPGCISHTETWPLGDKPFCHLIPCQHGSRTFWYHFPLPVPFLAFLMPAQKYQCFVWMSTYLLLLGACGEPDGDRSCCVHFFFFLNLLEGGMVDLELAELPSESDMTVTVMIGSDEREWLWSSAIGDSADIIGTHSAALNNEHNGQRYAFFHCVQLNKLVYDKT